MFSAFCLSKCISKSECMLYMGVHYSWVNNFMVLTNGKVNMNPGGRGTPIWNRRGCSLEILNLTPKGDRLGMAQALCDP